jgi:hypothetical protein
LSLFAGRSRYTVVHSENEGSAGTAWIAAFWREYSLNTL